jgi:hypothetical protein
MVLGVVSSVQAQQAVPWCLEDGGNGHWYRPVYAQPARTPEQWITWATANGGHLASIASAAENSIVYLAATNTIDAVIGGKRNSSNVFQWVDGTAWQFTAWSNGEPSCTCERYLMLYPTGWNDTNTTVRSWAIVEYSADCNSDGIVDYGQIQSGFFSDTNGNSVPDCCEQSRPCPTWCPADIVRDGQVNGVDLASVLSQWGTSGSGPNNADIDRNGTVNGVDLSIVLASWGSCATDPQCQ